MIETRSASELGCQYTLAAPTPNYTGETMSSPQPLYSKKEFARRGDKIYEHDILPHLTAADEGKFVVIDIETGSYEIDGDEIAASDRLLVRRPEAQMWMTRVGSRGARRFGPRRQSAIV